MITVNDLNKNFGTIQAIKDISFTVPKGEILGLLGPNGAGKTTTMRILTCFMPPSSGTASVGGYDILKDSYQVRRLIGYMPENPPVYPEMNVVSYLRFVAEIKEVSKSKIASHVEEAMEKVNIENIRGRIIGHLSRGYRQRVGLAQALVHQPQVLIFDEPTLGLDPSQIIEIRELIKSLANSHTIIVSSHILPEVQALCDQVAIIDHGNIVAKDSLKNLTQEQKLYITVKGDHSLTKEIEKKLQTISGITQAQFECKDQLGLRFKLSFEKDSPDIREKIYELTIKEKIPILDIHVVRTTLEEIFLRVISGAETHE